MAEQLCQCYACLDDWFSICHFGVQQVGVVWSFVDQLLGKALGWITSLPSPIASCHGDEAAKGEEIV